MSSRLPSTGTPQVHCESQDLHGHEPELSVLTLRAAEQDVVVVVGEADLATAPLLHDRLVQALSGRRRPVVVELGALTFCDLCGLDALRAAARTAEAAGTRLTFRGQSAQLRWLQRTFPPAQRLAGSSSCAGRGTRAAPAVLTTAATSPPSRAGVTGTPEPRHPRAPAPPDPGLPALTHEPPDS